MADVSALGAITSYNLLANIPIFSYAGTDCGKGSSEKGSVKLLLAFP